LTLDRAGHPRHVRRYDSALLVSSRPGQVHPLADILLARILAIACGHEDADDLDALRTDPAFKLACGRLPESGADLMSCFGAATRDASTIWPDIGM
jgi:hypothetical protein